MEVLIILPRHALILTTANNNNLTIPSYPLLNETLKNPVQLCYITNGSETAPTTQDYIQSLDGYSNASNRIRFEPYTDLLFTENDVLFSENRNDADFILTNYHVYLDTIMKQFRNNCQAFLQATLNSTYNFVICIIDSNGFISDPFISNSNLQLYTQNSEYVTFVRDPTLQETHLLIVPKQLASWFFPLLIQQQELFINTIKTAWTNSLGNFNSLEGQYGLFNFNPDKALLLLQELNRETIKKLDINISSYFPTIVGPQYMLAAFCRFLVLPSPTVTKKKSYLITIITLFFFGIVAILLYHKSSLSLPQLDFLRTIRKLRN